MFGVRSALASKYAQNQLAVYSNIPVTEDEAQIRNFLSNNNAAEEIADDSLKSVVSAWNDAVKNSSYCLSESPKILCVMPTHQKTPSQIPFKASESKLSIQMTPADQLTAYDILSSDYVWLDKECVSELQRQYGQF